MRARKNKGILVGVVLAILGMALFSSPGICAAPPQGVLKEAIHWNISADWLDPSTAPASTLSWFALQLLHDALVKPLGGG